MLLEERGAIAQAGFGICSRCSRPIEIARLHAHPDTTLCEKYAHVALPPVERARRADARRWQDVALGHFGCLPVVDGEGWLEEIVTETDLLYALASLDGGGTREQRSDALTALVSELESERACIAQELDRYHSVERELTQDTRERPMDQPERSAEQDVVSLTSSLDGLATRRLAAIDHARQGRLSVCDRCGGPISLPRLRSTARRSASTARAGRKRADVGPLGRAAARPPRQHRFGERVAVAPACR
jgi:RNA polymerase-binding transcription factor DksA